MSGQLWQTARIKSLDDVVGNAEAMAELRAFQTGFMMISGPIGCGKTSTALAWVNERYGVRLEEQQTIYVADKYYLQHVHAANFDLSDTRGKLWFGWRIPTVLLVDEAQDLTEKRQQSKLKTIPKRDNLTLVLITSNPEDIESSIRDRCAKIRLGPLSARELPTLVNRACDLRGIPYDPTIVQALNRGEVFRPRAILNAVDAIARGKSIVQAVAGQDTQSS